MKPKDKNKTKLPPSSPTKGRSSGNAAEKKRRLTLALIIAAFGFILYSNTLSHGYVLDDFSAVKENNIVRQGISAIPEIFKTSYRQGYLSVKDGLYRPLSLATYAIEWNYFPDQPGVAHFVNVVLYALTGFLLFLLLCRFMPRSSPADILKAEAFAFIASLLFIAHPLHVEVTANIKSRDEIMCFLFVICSFLGTFRYLQEGKKRFLALALLCYFASLLSKETSITALALLPLALHFFSGTGMKKIIITTAFFIVIAGIYLLIRSQVLQGAMADDGVSVADNVVVGAKTINTHLGTAFHILALYVQMLLFPHPMSYDYSYTYLPEVGLNDPLALVALVLYTGIGVYAAWILIRSLKKDVNEQARKNFPLAFGILFFLITIFLFSNLVLIIGTSMGDRLMYFPSLGFSIVIAILLVRILKIESLDLKTGTVKLILPLAIILMYSYQTYSRNPLWKDNYTLYAHDVNIVPNSVKAHYYLGLEIIKVKAEEEQDPEKKKKWYMDGIHELEQSVKIMPSFASAYTQMGVAWYRLKNFEKAIENYNIASSMKPADAITLNNTGSVYFEWGKYDKALESFQAALKADERFVDAYMNQGSVYGTIKEYQKAIESFRSALKYAPDNARAYYFIAITYQNMGDVANADRNFQIAGQIDPKLKKPGTP